MLSAQKQLPADLVTPSYPLRVSIYEDLGLRDLSRHFFNLMFYSASASVHICEMPAASEKAVFDSPKNDNRLDFQPKKFHLNKVCNRLA